MILRNGQPYVIDTPFTAEDGAQFPSNWYRLASEEDRIRHGFREVPDPEPVDDRYFFINADGTSTEKPLDQSKQVVLNQLSAIRWNKENEGIVYSNTVFATDSASRSNYLSTLQVAANDDTFSVSWKAKDTNDVSVFVTLTANDILNISKSSIDYVSKCFSKEKDLTDKINKVKSLNTLLKIDLNADWPSRDY